MSILCQLFKEFDVLRLNGKKAFDKIDLERSCCAHRFPFTARKMRKVDGNSDDDDDDDDGDDNDDDNDDD